MPFDKKIIFAQLNKCVFSNTLGFLYILCCDDFTCQKNCRQNITVGRFFLSAETYFPENIPFEIFGNFPILLTNHKYLPNKHLQTI